MTRLRIQKTLKLYIGGAFVRSESGRTSPTRSARGEAMHAARASRKDFRDTLGKARAAQKGWAGRTAYNRGQILYRLGEMLDDRAEALPTSPDDIAAAVDRAVFHAGWADKITALLSSLNPVGMAYVNYSMIRPMGIIAAFPDPADGLLGMVEALCAPLVMGNAVILVVPSERAELAVALAEALATSDVPGGVVNVLTTDVADLLPHVVTHDDLDCVYVAGAALSPAQLQAAQHEGAQVMRRLLQVGGAAQPAAPHDLQRLAEVKTVWMSSGADIATGGGY